MAQKAKKEKRKQIQINEAANKAQEKKVAEEISNKKKQEEDAKLAEANRLAEEQRLKEENEAKINEEQILKDEEAARQAREELTRIEAEELANKTIVITQQISQPPLADTVLSLDEIIKVKNINGQKLRYVKKRYPNVTQTLSAWETIFSNDGIS